MEAEAEELAWSRETIPRVTKIACNRLPQRDLVSLLLVSPWLNRTLVSYPSLWLVLDLREMTNAGNRLLGALSLLVIIAAKCSLFAIVGVTDKCLEALSMTCSNTLTTLDVNGCIGIKRRSREDLLKLFPHLKCFKVHS